MATEPETLESPLAVLPTAFFSPDLIALPTLLRSPLLRVAVPLSEEPPLEDPPLFCTDLIASSTLSPPEELLEELEEGVEGLGEDPAEAFALPFWNPPTAAPATSPAAPEV